MKIFITYRHQDSQWISLTLFNELKKKFGEQNVFKDFHAIQPGDDFTKAIDAGLNSCNVLLVVIGKDWLSCTDEKGNRRLDAPLDFVRSEIESALRLGKKIIPVMVDGAMMPEENELPTSIHELHKKQSISISHSNYEMDVFKLINSLYEVTGERNPHSQFIKDFASGKIGDNDLIKPDSNAPYTMLCFGVGIIAIIGYHEVPTILAVGLLVIVAGLIGLFLSSKVKTLWLSQKFEDARTNARRTKYLSILAPSGGVFIMVVYGLLQLFALQEDPMYQDVKNMVANQATANDGTNSNSEITNSGTQNSTPVYENRNEISGDAYQQPNEQQYITISSYDYGQLLSRYGLSAQISLVIGNQEYPLNGTDLPISIIRPGEVEYKIVGTCTLNGLYACSNNSYGRITLVNNAHYYLCHDSNSPQGDCGFYLYSQSQFKQQYLEAEQYFVNAFQ